MMRPDELQPSRCWCGTDMAIRDLLKENPDLIGKFILLLNDDTEVSFGGKDGQDVVLYEPHRCLEITLEWGQRIKYHGSRQECCAAYVLMRSGCSMQFVFDVLLSEMDQEAGA